MKYDKSVPTQLLNTQEWFGSIICRPISSEDKIDPITPRGVAIVDEAKEYINPSPTLRPHERIELYNQQYWWRLHNTLVDIVPLTPRLFGNGVMFDTITMPYLCKYPPNHFSLNGLGDRLPIWFEKEYQGEDKELVVSAAKLDVAFNSSFLSREGVALTKETHDLSDMQGLLGTTLYLQPYLHLFKMGFDLFDFRDKMLKNEPKYWEEHDFPELKRDREICTVIYRTPELNVGWMEISLGEYTLFKCFEKGCTIKEACERLGGESEAIYQDASQNLARWFQKWVGYRWLCIEGEEAHTTREKSPV